MGHNQPVWRFTVKSLFALACLWPASAGAESLADAVVAALNNHPRVEAALANRKAFLAQEEETYAGYFPRVDIRGAGGRKFADNSTSRGLQVTRESAYSYLWEGSATLTQPLFDGFETANRLAAVRARQKSAGYELADVRENLALQTIIAYLEILRSGEIREEMEAYEIKLASYMERLASMVEQGGGDETLLIKARDIQAQLGSTLVSVNAAYRAARAQYEELTGHLPDEIGMARPVPRLDLVPEDMAAALEFVRVHHPAIMAQQYEETAMKNQADAEEQSYYPDIDGELSYLKRDQKEEIGGEIIDAQALVRLNWSISMAGADRARVKRSLYRYEEARARRKEIEQQIERQLRLAYNDLAKAQQQLKIQQERLEINQSLVNTYQAQFEGARVSLLQLLQADNTLFNTRLELINSTYSLLAAQYTVLASMGLVQEALDIAAIE